MGVHCAAGIRFGVGLFADGHVVNPMSWLELGPFRRSMLSSQRTDRTLRQRTG